MDIRKTHRINHAVPCKAHLFRTTAMPQQTSEHECTPTRVHASVNLQGMYSRSNVLGVGHAERRRGWRSNLSREPTMNADEALKVLDRFTEAIIYEYRSTRESC